MAELELRRANVGDAERLLEEARLSQLERLHRCPYR